MVKWEICFLGIFELKVISTELPDVSSIEMISIEAEAAFTVTIGRSIANIEAPAMVAQIFFTAVIYPI